MFVLVQHIRMHHNQSPTSSLFHPNKLSSYKLYIIIIGKEKETNTIKPLYPIQQRENVQFRMKNEQNLKIYLFFITYNCIEGAGGIKQWAAVSTYRRVINEPPHPKYERLRRTPF